MWCRLQDGGYVHVDRMEVIFPVELPPLDGTNFGINARTGSNVWRLAGEWATASAAQEVILRLVDGIEPTE